MLPNLTKSLAMQERAKKRIPGMTQLLSKRPDQFSLGLWPGYFSRAEGARVWDLDDNEYLDCSLGGIGATVLGYCDPEVDAAVNAAIKAGNSSSLNAPEEVELAELLCELHPWAEMVRYARTGGEAMAIAVRIARAATGRDKVAFCGYHGWHDWYLAANVGTENALGEHLLPGLNPAGVPRGLAGTALPFRYNRLDELEAIIAEHGTRLAAIVMEPIRNAQPIPGFLDGVRALASKVGAVLIVDEISAGFRLCTGGAHLCLGLTPDVAVFSKALGNGYPIAAVIGRASVMQAAQISFISSTYWTDRIGPAAALATLQKHRACNVAEHLNANGKLVQEGWSKIAKRHSMHIEIGGIPPFPHFSFKEGDASAQKAFFIQAMLEQGFLASTSFYMMYTHNPGIIQKYMNAADISFAAIKQALNQGTLLSQLVGAPARMGFSRLT